MQEYKRICCNCGNEWLSGVEYEKELEKEFYITREAKGNFRWFGPTVWDYQIASSVKDKIEARRTCNKCGSSNFSCQIVGEDPLPPPEKIEKSSAGVIFLALVIGVGNWFIFSFLVEKACFYLNKYEAPSSAQIHQENINYQNEIQKYKEKRQLILKIEKQIKDKVQKEKDQKEKDQKEKVEDEKKRLVLAKEEGERINRTKEIEENFRMRMEKMQKEAEKTKEEVGKSNRIARVSLNLPSIGSSVVIKTKYGSIIEGKLEKTTQEGVVINRGDVVMMLPKNTLSLESVKIFYSNIDTEKD
jgi:hypothetical protein